MKKIITLIMAVVAISGQVVAQSVLRVRLADNSRFNVSVNGRYFNTKGTSVTVGDLPAGNHYVKIYKVSFDRWGRAFDRTIFQGTVRTRNGMVSQMVYDPYSRRMGVNLIPENNGINRPQDTYNDPNRAQYNDVQEPDRIANKERQAVSNEPLPPVAEADNNEIAKGRPAASPMPEGSMTDSDMEALKAKIAAQKTDTEKLKLLKSELRKETIITLQLSEMLDWMLFESTRVELAKWAYHITEDKDFFGDIFSKFSYQSSKDELKMLMDNRK
jgi:hypothetical protein